MTILIEIPDMSCQHCVAGVTRALEAVPGVTGVAVDLESKRARVEGSADTAALVQAVTDAGYQPRLI